MDRYRFVWFGDSAIYVSPCCVPFGTDAVLVRDFDRFADFVRSPYCFPRGVAWVSNLSDVHMFKLFKKKGLQRCVKSYRLLQAEEL